MFPKVALSGNLGLDDSIPLGLVAVTQPDNLHNPPLQRADLAPL